MRIADIAGLNADSRNALVLFDLDNRVLTALSVGYDPKELAGMWRLFVKKFGVSLRTAGAAVVSFVPG